MLRVLECVYGLRNGFDLRRLWNNSNIFFHGWFCALHFLTTDRCSTINTYLHIPKCRRRYLPPFPFINLFQKSS